MTINGIALLSHPLKEIKIMKEVKALKTLTY